jgi:glucose/arabinose dehydrogenase
MNLRVLTLIALVSGLMTASAVAQQTDQKPQPAGQKEQRRPTNETAPRPVDPNLPMRVSSNIRVELTISDSTGSATPQKKTVSMTIADRRMGRIRSISRKASGILNIDATPTIAEGNRVYLQLTLEYLPDQAGEASADIAVINEMVSVVLDNGKPMVISQGADPASDRRVTVEVNATILK